jgi:hypothetical protein
MAIEKILEHRMKVTAFFSQRVKSEILAHCSCGKDYNIKEKFSYETQCVIRPTKCPYCKEKSYIEHDIKLTLTDELELTEDWIRVIDI